MPLPDGVGFFYAKIVMRTRFVFSMPPHAIAFYSLIKMLPPELLNIIDQYVEAFDICESLPKISAIRRLILKSNQNLMKIATRFLGIPPQIMMLIIQIDDTTHTDINHALIFELDDCITTSLMTHFATPSLFWLFIEKQPTLYFGPYAVMFEQSLLFKLISVITSAPREESA